MFTSGVKLAMTNDDSQHRMAAGRAIMYLTLLVKCNRRKRFPAKPQANDKALKMSSLSNHGKRHTIITTDTSTRETGLPFWICYTDSSVL